MTYEFIAKIKLIEDKIKNLNVFDNEDKSTNFWKKVCLVDSIAATDCAPKSFQSPVDVLMQNEVAISGVSNLQLQEDFVAKLLYKWEAWQNYHYLFNHDEDIIKENGKVKYMRTIMRLGLPFVIDGTKYQNSQYLYDEQRDYAVKFKEEIEAIISSELKAQSGKKMKAIVYQEASMQDNTIELFLVDFSYSLYSSVVQMLYMFIYLRSILLTIYLGLIVFFSFTCTAVITEGIFKVKYFTMSHQVVVFILIHVAADGVFYFTENWRRSNHFKEYKQRLSQRFAYTTRVWIYHMNDSMLMMAVSIFTFTLVPYMPFRAYAIFAGTLVIVTWLQLYFAYPPMLFWYEAFWEKNFDSRIKRCFTTKTRNVDKFFKTSFNWVVSYFKKTIFSLYLLMTVLMIYRILRIPTLKSSQAFLNEKHELQAGSLILRDEFYGQGPGEIDIVIQFGIKGHDKNFFYDEEKLSYWSTKEVGGPIFDPVFDIYSKRN